MLQLVLENKSSLYKQECLQMFQLLMCDNSFRTVHFNFQSSIVFELADNTLCCNIMQYLAKMIVGDVSLPLFDGVFKIL